MGMFDTVIATCPTCKAEAHVQSKAGECRLLDYPIGDLDPEKNWSHKEIAEHLLESETDYRTTCAQCGARYHFAQIGWRQVPVFDLLPGIRTTEHDPDTIQ